MCVVCQFQNWVSREIFKKKLWCWWVGGLLSGLGAWRGRIHSHHQSVRFSHEAKGETLAEGGETILLLIAKGEKHEKPKYV
jgi:hypothetical protein